MHATKELEIKRTVNENNESREENEGNLLKRINGEIEKQHITEF